MITVIITIITTSINMITTILTTMSTTIIAIFITIQASRSIISLWLERGRGSLLGPTGAAEA